MGVAHRRWTKEIIFSNRTRTKLVRANLECLMDKLKLWYNDNYGEITWFLIGFCACAGIDALAKEDYFGAGLNWLVSVLNYVLYRKGKDL
jgi:hypothetical protein